MKYIYEIQAFAYSDFEHYILLHEKKYSDIQFREMIEKARQKAKPKTDEFGRLTKSWDYPYDVIKVLIEDYGFEYSHHNVAYVGCDYDDKCEVEEAYNYVK